MKKRTYKQMQNRLYREIKRRMIAEQVMKFPIPVHVEHQNFDTLVIRNLFDKHAIPENDAKYAEHIKREMAYQIADKLMDEGYINYYTKECLAYEPLFEKIELEARIRVVR